MKCDALKPTVWAELNDLLQTRGFFLCRLLSAAIVENRLYGGLNDERESCVARFSRRRLALWN